MGVLNMLIRFSSGYYVVNGDVSRPETFRVGVVMLLKQGFGGLLEEALWKQKLHELVWLGIVCKL
jgi:hypothetical protein